MRHHDPDTKAWAPAHREKFELGPPLLELEESNEDGHDGWTSIRPRAPHRVTHPDPERRDHEIDIAA